jgi:molybdopterin converting factor small subunit
MKLVFHGKFADIAGSNEIILARPPSVATLGDLQVWLVASLPFLEAPLKGRGAATVINQTVVRDICHPVYDSDEVAFLPPMSGG